MPVEDWLYQTRAFGKLVAKAGPLRRLAARRYSDVFANSPRGGIYHGVYASFDEAAAAAPPKKPASYDNAAAAGMYRDRLDRVYPSDYPILFWLQKLLPEVRTVFDLGGHVGIARYAYARYLELPADLKWTVYDLPSVVESGRQLAQQRNLRGLSFTTSLDDASGTDLLFSAGALQYLEHGLPKILSNLSSLPAHLLLNLLPLSEQPTFHTLQHIGTAVCPYAIMNGNQLVDGLAALGYERVDHWENPEKSCHIPFHEQRSLEHYEGLYLRLEPGSGDAARGSYR